MKQVISLVGCLILGLLLSSCWPNADRQPVPSPTLLAVSPTPTPEVPKPLMACELVAKSEVEAIVGEALLDPKQSEVKTTGEIYQQGCLYLAASGGFTPSVHVTIMYVDVQNQSLLEETWQASRSAEQKYPRFQDVTSLPTRAYQGADSLLLQQENYIVSVSVAMKETSQNREANLKLAAEILAKWPHL